MILTKYWTGRKLSLQVYHWASQRRHGTVVAYGYNFRVRETPAEIEALYLKSKRSTMPISPRRNPSHDPA